MKEILPSIYHWRVKHPEIGVRVSSYYLEKEGIVIDPLVPEEGIKWFDDRKPREVILTNRLHERDSELFRNEYGCRIWMHRAGPEQGDVELDNLELFGFGDRLPGDIEVLEVDAICPDDSALFIPMASGIVAFADGVMRHDDGSLGFVPDEIMADSSDEVKRVKGGILTALEKILSTHDFEHLFFAHGDPLLGDGKDRLRRFVEGQER